jgi:hypothetical protein
MSAPACAACNRQTLAHDVVAGQFFCGNAGCREYLITCSAPEIAQLRDRLTRASVPRTSMDPQLDDDATGTSHVTSRDPLTLELFGDIHPENIPDEPRAPKITEPSDSEGAEAGGAR